MHSRACVLQLSSLRAATTEACARRAHAMPQENPPQWEARALQQKTSSRSPQLEKVHMQQLRHNAAKNKLKVRGKKPTVRYHLTHVTMSVVKKTRNKCWWSCGEKGPLVHCRWECTLLQLLWKTMENPYKVQKGTSIWSSNSTSVYLSTGSEIIISKRYLYLRFIAALFTIFKIRKQSKCPLMDEWI